MIFIKLLQKMLKLDIEKKIWYFKLCNSIDRPFAKGKKKAIGLMKPESGGKIMINVFGIKAKTYSYLIVDGNEAKKAKGTKRSVMKRKRKLENYKNCLKQLSLRIE